MLKSYIRLNVWIILSLNFSIAKNLITADEYLTIVCVLEIVSRFELFLHSIQDYFKL